MVSGPKWFLHWGTREVIVREQPIGRELAFTLTLVVLLVAAVLLIANLIGAIHVFG